MPLKEYQELFLTAVPGLPLSIDGYDPKTLLQESLNEGETQCLHWQNLQESLQIFSMASAGDMVQENEHKENENEPTKTPFFKFILERG